MGTIEPRVKFGEARPKNGDVKCLIVFLIAFVTHLVLGFVVMSSENVYIGSVANKPADFQQCSGFTGSFVYCSEKLLEELQECENSPGGRRLLGSGSDDENDHATVFSVFGDYPAIPSTAVVMIVAISVIWCFILRAIPHGMVWGTMAIKVALWIGIGVWFKYQSSNTGADLDTQAYLCWAFAGLFVAFIFYHRSKYERAGDHLEMAMKGLLARPAIFGYAAIVEVVYLVYLAVYTFFVTRTSVVWEVGRDEFGRCGVKMAGWSSNSMYFITFMMIWTTYYAKNTNLVISSMALGSWYFGDEGAPDNITRSAFKTALTSSAGTISIGSLVTAITQELLRLARNKLWWTNPWGCVLKIILVMVQKMIEALTKFSMIMHAFSGEDFFTSAKDCYGVMKKHFFQGMITDSVGQSVVTLGAYVFSLGVGFATWAWVDNKYGWKTLGTAFPGEESWEYLFYVFMILFVWLTLYPMRTIFVVSILTTYLTGYYSAPLTALFVSCVANIVLSFVGSLVINGMDTMFVCYAIGKEKNFQPQDQSMYILLGEIAVGGADGAPHVANQQQQYIGGPVATAVPVAQAVPAKSYV